MFHFAQFVETARSAATETEAFEQLQKLYNQLRNELGAEAEFEKQLARWNSGELSEVQWICGKESLVDRLIGMPDEFVGGPCPRTIAYIRANA